MSYFIMLHEMKLCITKLKNINLVAIISWNKKIILYNYKILLKKMISQIKTSFVSNKIKTFTIIIFRFSTAGRIVEEARRSHPYL